MLTSEQILFILKLIAEKYGPYYSDEKKVAQLEAKLSIMLEAARQTE